MSQRPDFKLILGSSILWLCWVTSSHAGSAPDAYVPQRILPYRTFGETPQRSYNGTFALVDMFIDDRSGPPILASELSWEQQERSQSKRSGGTSRNTLRAGGGDLRSLLTLPSAAVPNDVPPRPPIFLSDLDPSAADIMAGKGGFPATTTGFADDSRALRIRWVRFPRVRSPHLWASVGTLAGSAWNIYQSGYTLSQFSLRFNSWTSEKIAMRQQGADLVQHFILGYGLTRYFLDNGSSVVGAGVSAFTYEFIAGEVFESFPQAGGISVRDVAADILAVTVGMIDSRKDSPLRYWAGSTFNVKPSAPNEFDPYRIRLGVVVAHVAGMELVCTVENWKDPPPRRPDLEGLAPLPPAYYMSRR